MEQSHAGFNIRVAYAAEYPEAYTSEYPYLPIEKSTLNVFTVNFELRKLITNCDPNVDRMTPCLNKEYDKLFGSDFNNAVRKCF